MLSVSQSQLSCPGIIDTRFSNRAMKGKLNLMVVVGFDIQYKLVLELDSKAGYFRVNVIEIDRICSKL